MSRDCLLEHFDLLDPYEEVPYVIMLVGTYLGNSCRKGDKSLR